MGSPYSKLLNAGLRKPKVNKSKGGATKSCTSFFYPLSADKPPLPRVRFFQIHIHADCLLSKYGWNARQASEANINPAVRDKGSSHTSDNHIHYYGRIKVKRRELQIYKQYCCVAIFYGNKE